MAGLYFEEFEIGQLFEHPIRRTITEADNVLITTMTHNPASLHLDAEYMKSTEYGKPLVNSCLTLGMIDGEILTEPAAGEVIVALHARGADVEDLLVEEGEIPLPPYIHVPLPDGARYQTVFAKTVGSAAAPTAATSRSPCPAGPACWRCRRRPSAGSGSAFG